MADEIEYVSNPVVQDLPEKKEEASKAKAKPAAKDDMTFAQAFAAARKAKGAGATFTWRGKKYSTDMAGDKKPTPSQASASSSSSSSPGSTGTMSNYSRAKAARGAAEGALKARGSLPAPNKTRADERASKLARLKREAEAPGASRLTKDRYKMAKETGMYAKGGKVKPAKKTVKKYAAGGSVKASKRGDGIARKGKTKCKVY